MLVLMSLLLLIIIVLAVLLRSMDPMDQAILALARQTARWSTAAQQDESPFIANLHANYGAAYIFSLRQIARDEDILRVTGQNAKDLEDQVVAIQDQAARRIIDVCPSIAPTGPLAELGGEA